MSDKDLIELLSSEVNRLRAENLALRREVRWRREAQAAGGRAPRYQGSERAA